jgi:hypothetical protein
MWNLADIMQAAQGGQAMMNLAQQFGLSPAQTQRAVEALLPAFSLGLQRQAETATNYASMIALMSTGKFSPFFEQQEARATEAEQQGGAVVDQLFGTPEISRQVAAHAAVLSGVPTEVLMRMQPIMAAMIMGGLFKTAMGSGLGALFAQMSETMQKAGAAGTGQAAQAKPEAETHAGPAGDIFGPLFGNMFAAFLGKRDEPESAKPSKPTDRTVADATQEGLAQLNRLFEAGSQVQRDYVETMQKILDRMSGSKA